eukprot:4845157-Amphidinium_carterae.1
MEAPPEAGLRSDQCWRLRRAMNGLRVSSRLFQDHLAKILRTGGFEQSKAEKCLFMHRALKVMVTVHVDDPIVAGTSKVTEGIKMFFKVPDSSGVRDKLDKSANLVATTGALSMSDREISGVAVSLMFV